MQRAGEVLAAAGERGSGGHGGGGEIWWRERRRCEGGGGGLRGVRGWESGGVGRGWGGGGALIVLLYNTYDMVWCCTVQGCPRGRVPSGGWRVASGVWRVASGLLVAPTCCAASGVV